MRWAPEVLHSVQFIPYIDPGYALVSSTMRNLYKTLYIQLIVHKAHNSSVTDLVEKARDIIECHFESSLRFVEVDNIDELNHLVRLYPKIITGTHC